VRIDYTDRGLKAEGQKEPERRNANPEHIYDIADICHALAGKSGSFVVESGGEPGKLDCTI
jgi:hypothetical protein